MSLTAGKQLLLSSPAGGYQVSRSLRFNSADSANLSKTFASAGTQTTWTLSCWFKLCRPGSNFRVTPLFSGSSPWGGISIYQDKIRFAAYNGAYIVHLHTTQVLRDPSAWYHLVAVFDSNNGTSGDRARLYLNGSRITTFSTETYPSPGATTTINSTGQQYIGYEESNVVYSDCYFADIWFLDGIATDASSFAKTDATTGQWIPKTYTGSKGTNGFHLEFADNSNNTATTLGKDTSGNGNNWTPNSFSVTGTVNHVTSGLSYRKGARYSSWDTSSADSTPSSSVAADNYWWVDLGSSKTINKIEFDATITGTGSADFYFLYSTSSSSSGSSGCPAGCTITATRSITGAAPNHHVVFTGFGNITGRYIGISNGTAGSSPTTFSNLRVLDDQGKDNDSLVDTPTSYGTDTGVGGEVRGNYCTWNPLGAGTNISLSNGNLDATSNTNDWRQIKGTFGVSSGKWYWESTVIASTLLNEYHGISNDLESPATNLGTISGYCYGHGGDKYAAGVNTGGAGASYTTGDTIGMALDLDSGTQTIKFYKNGTLQFTQTISGSAPWYPASNCYYIQTGPIFVTNFGQRPFAYAAPTGYKALCDTNLSAPVIAKPNTVFDIALYTGNGTTQTISGLNFSPDAVWCKERSSTSNHHIIDTVRGATYGLLPNDTRAEAVVTGSLTAFTSDGFTVGDNGAWNESSQTYVAWCWDAGSSNSTNESGSITSTVRANASAGFSIVTFTGSSGNQTIGHGLGAVPQLIILKYRNGASGWYTYHGAVASGNNNLLTLNTANTVDSSANYWNSTAPTSTVFTLGSSLNTSNTWVAYCFAPVTNFSAFGKYTGNGSSNGPFIHTGMRPKWILIKEVSGTAEGNWIVWDTSRSTFNAMDEVLLPNSNVAELANETSVSLDVLSNGFKIRSTSDDYNGSAGTFVYAAFAENPFQYARAR